MVPLTGLLWGLRELLWARGGGSPGMVATRYVLCRGEPLHPCEVP